MVEELFRPAAGAGNITDQETIDALRKSNAGNLQASNRCRCWCLAGAG